MSQLKKHMQEEEFAGRLRLSAWRQIARIFWRHKRFFGGYLLSAGVLAATDTALPATMGRLLDALRDGEPLRNVLGYAGLYAAEATFLTAMIFVLIFCAGKIAPAVAYDIRRTCFAKLQELPFSYYDTRSVGWLMARLTSDCDKVSNTTLWFCCDLLWGSSVALFSATVMLVINWRVALAVLAIVPVLAVITRWFQVRLLHTSRDVSRTNSLITARHTENINGVRTTKALAHEDDNISQFDELNTAMRGAAVRHGLWSAMYMPIVWAIGGVGTAMALAVGGHRVMRGDMQIGQMVAFMSYATLMVIPVLEIARQVAELQRAQAAAERIGSLLDTKPDIRDSEDVARRIAAQRSPQQAAPGIAEDGLPDSIDEIAFNGVHFWYVPEEPVLQDFNLCVSAGETIALVGPTGGGKTTIVQLMCRFYEPNRGEVRINGTDYRNRSLRWLQSNLGFVLQQPQLFGGTVADNIRYGKLDASEDEVRRAAELVRAHDFICGLEDGYESDVGEGGGKLSSGQKQLISFARAVLADPKIFVMDEATSSVDSETERLIQEGVEQVLAGRISFVIAHRLSTIRNADRILFIDGGHVIEEGTHDELLRARGRYYRLYVSQFQRLAVEGAV